MDPGAGQQYGGEEDPMAYGDYHGPPPANPEDPEDFGEGTEGERGMIGDTYRKFRGKYQSQYDGSSQSKPKPSSGGLGSFFLNKVKDAVEDIGSKLESNIGPVGSNKHSHTHVGVQCDDGTHNNTQHRYGSFAAQRTQNDAKWYVDGCGYMWAVSEALERATESVWILDCKDSVPCQMLCLLIHQQGGCHLSSICGDHHQRTSNIGSIVCSKLPLNVVSR